MAQIQYQFKRLDEYFTPAYAVYPIMQRLRPGATIWCPFDTKESEYVKVFSHNGFHVIYGHIQTGQDFFQTDVPDCDYIISNPPYSLQDLKARAETDPAAAAELARQRAYQTEKVKKSRQKMYEDAAAGNPEAQARYERFLAVRRENYHRKKQEKAEAVQTD